MEKNINEIIKLIALFYDGETSPEQEQALHDYFMQDNVDAELQGEKEIFLKLYSLHGANDIEIPQGIDNELGVFIDGLAKKEKRKKLYLSWKIIGGVAASIFIALSVLLFTRQQEEKSLLVDTYSTPEEAYEETERTLLLVSSKLDKGLDQWEKAEENMSRVNRILNEKFH